MSHQTPTIAENYDWSDPHGFHHDPESPHQDHGHHHVTSWQRLVGILIVLLFLTGLTVAAAQAETWAIERGVTITHFWNVLIALSIATVKAALVCMYFMHLRHDSPLNTVVLLTTLFVFGLFLFLTGIDIAERDTVNPFKAVYAQAGGTGVGIGDLTTNITAARKHEKIEAKARSLAAEHGRETPTEEDLDAARAYFWADYYGHKLHDHPDHLPPRHPDDEDDFHAAWVDSVVAHPDHAEVSTADQSRPRHGLTPGLFDEHEPAPADAGHDDHAEIGDH